MIFNDSNRNEWGKITITVFFFYNGDVNNNGGKLVVKWDLKNGDSEVARQG